jgi:hypothetical protein
MVTRISILTCEGPHDIAFLYRILREGGIKLFRENLGSLPEPARKVLLSHRFLEKATIEDSKIDVAGKHSLPSEIFQKDNAYIFVYEMRGDATVRRKDLVSALISTIPVEGEIIPYGQGNEVKFSFISILDSDTKGIENRMEVIQKDFASTLVDASQFPKLENGKIHEYDGIRWGGYIFSNEGTDFGRLEDLLLGLMREGNSDIFGPADEFLAMHRSSSLFSGDNTTYANDGDRYPLSVGKGKRKAEFDYQKSVVSTVGQLQKSGKANTIVIKETDFLTDSKIHDSIECQKILRFVADSIS